MSKKNTFSRLLKWLADAGLKSLVIFGLLLAGYYAYGALTWPDDVNPKTGVVGVFVGASSNAFDGNTVKGYKLANDTCEKGAGVLVGSHICTPDEMVNSYNHGAEGVSDIFTYSAFNSLWINSGPPGYLASANDCKGWTVATRGNEDDPNFGAIWMFPGRKGGLTDCATGRRFACCK